MIASLIALPLWAHDEEGAEERNPGPFLVIRHQPLKGSNEIKGAIAVESPFDSASLESLALFRARYPRVQAGLDQIASALYGEQLPALVELLKDEEIQSIQVRLAFDRPFYEARNQMGFESANLMVFVSVDGFIGNGEMPLSAPFDTVAFSHLLKEAAAKAQKQVIENSERIKQKAAEKVHAAEAVKSDPFFGLLPKR